MIQRAIATLCPRDTLERARVRSQDLKILALHHKFILRRDVEVIERQPTPQQLERGEEGRSTDHRTLLCGIRIIPRPDPHQTKSGVGRVAGHRQVRHTPPNPLPQLKLIPVGVPQNHLRIPRGPPPNHHALRRIGRKVRRQSRGRMRGRHWVKFTRWLGSRNLFVWIRIRGFSRCPLRKIEGVETNTACRRHPGGTLSLRRRHPLPLRCRYSP